MNIKMWIQTLHCNIRACHSVNRGMMMFYKSILGGVVCVCVRGEVVGTKANTE